MTGVGEHDRGGDYMTGASPVTTILRQVLVGEEMGLAS